MIKFTQNSAGATAEINDGQETYYTRHEIATKSDVADIVAAFGRRYDGGGDGDVTAMLTVLVSRSRKYRPGAEVEFSF